MLDENGTRVLSNIQFHQYRMLEGIYFHVALKVALNASIICTIGGQLMKTLFAYVNKTENFVFTFHPGISDNNIYPGMSRCISRE